MYIIVERIYIFRALQRILSFIGGSRPSLAILGHVLLQVRDDHLLIIGSDIDMEIIVNIPINKIYEIGRITAPARKLFDICRTLSDQSNIVLKYQEDKLFISSEKSYFSLVTFSASDFPSMSVWKSDIKFFISQSILKNLIELTYFSMGKEDIRYYLNGMLFEFHMRKFCTVTTDGHRLSFCSISLLSKELSVEGSYPIIVPRKYVMNIARILNNNKEKDIELKIGKKNISIAINDCVLTSKLINGIFPNYQSVFLENPKVVLDIDSKKLKQAVKRSMILCDEKFHVVRFILNVNQLKIISKNSDHEISEEIIDVTYSGHSIEIGFNVYYVLDVLNVIKSEKTRFCLIDENSAVQITTYPISINTYIIMPVRL